MGASDPIDRRDMMHLLRRAAFGGTPKDVDKLLKKAPTRGAAVDALLGSKVRKGRPPGKHGDSRLSSKVQATWWLKRMSKLANAAQEKLVFFWHDHFPSNHAVVNDAGMLAQQNATLRMHGLGSFRDLLIEVTRDPAMLDFLDGFRNVKAAPNENYGRELMELFSLGPKDVNGVPNYTQADVQVMARSLTGFAWADPNKRSKGVVVNAATHDGSWKVLFQGTPNERQGPLGLQQPDGTLLPSGHNVIDALFRHRDSDGWPTAARFITRKLWEWYAYPNPPQALIDSLANDFVNSGYVIRDLLREMWTHDAFYSDTARTSSAKNPVEFTLQALNALGAKTTFHTLPTELERMGIRLFDPPGVNGWAHGEPWLATDPYLARFNFTVDLVHNFSGAYKLKLLKLIDISDRDAGRILDGLLEMLDLEITPVTRQALIDYVDTGALMTSENNWFWTKVAGLVILLLTLPENQVH